METLCATTLPSCSFRAGLAIGSHVKGAGCIRTQTLPCAKTTLACRSSSYMVGISDLGILNVNSSKKVRAIVSRGLRCEASSEGAGNGVVIWIGRLAMVGFVAAIGTEIVSGKGVLANAGVGTPVPTLALALTAVVGGLVAFGVFRSASQSEE